MRTPFLQLFLFISLLGVGGIASGQITGDYIASHIALDTNSASEPYQKYSDDLAKTLSRLSADQLARVFGQPTDVQVEGTLNEHLDMEPVNFSPWSSDLTPSATEELDKVFEFLEENPTATILIEGHTEWGGAGNQRLSENRAAAALAYLVLMGISEDRIESAGFSSSRPLVEPGEGDTSVNRRIEIYVQ